MTLALDLTLLGFPGLRPDGSLFSRPNARLLEEVLHFLFGLYSPVECEQRFRQCWPPTTPLLAKQFRAEALRWSEELKRTGAWPRECVLRKSWLDESMGERLEECLGAIAEFLVRREGERTAGEDERGVVGGGSGDDDDGDGGDGGKRVKRCRRVENAHVYALECYLEGSGWNEMMEQLKRVEQAKNSLPVVHSAPYNRAHPLL